MTEECKVLQCGNPVFAAGKCRKHYEQEWLATAAPCSIFGCDKSSYRKRMCASHYREHTLKTHPLCVIPNCGRYQKNLKLGFCARHEFRSRTHGTSESPRPSDWGARAEHPLYKLWTWHKRKGHGGMCPEWIEDFWGFVANVGLRPEGHTLRRIDTRKPLSPTNWIWQESVISVDKAKYAREWRARNPEKAKNSDLKKSYGITLETYEKMLESQGGKCAICNNAEMSKDKDGGPRRMPVDHDHVTGKVRGLLCTSCNRALGLFKENQEYLKKAVLYLMLHNNNS